MFRRGLSLAAATFLTVCGANYMDPYLRAVRSWVPMTILLFGAIGLAIACRANSRSRLLIAAWLAVPVALGLAWSKHEMDRWTVAAADGADSALLGRHFVIGYDQLEQIEPLAVKGMVGGIVLNHRNIRGRTAGSVRDEIAQLQADRLAVGQPQLFVATDQEGGKVSHLSPVLPAMPPLSEIAGEAGDLAATARHYGAVQGKALAWLGVNVDFAPVLDLKSATGPRWIDTNSHIAERAISNDPDRVGIIALAYAQGLQDAGVIATAKHFPGLSRVRVDTHHFPARIDTARVELEQADWAPFRAVLRGSNAFMMIGHVTVAVVDPDNPASHSKRVVQEIIRDEWGYQGVLITDDLVMGAVYHFGFCKAVVDGLNAGIDLLLIAYDGEQYDRAMACALNALHDGRIDRAMLAASDVRLGRVKLPL
jgi:beta-N-acetylhexosaminidase